MADEIMNAPSQDETRALRFQSELNENLVVQTNLSTIMVVTTRDKIVNALHRTLPGHRRRHAWPAPAGVALTLFLTLFTATFEPVAGVSGEVIFGVVLALAVVSLAYLVVTIVRGWKGADIEGIADAISATHDTSTGTVIRAE